MIRISHAGGCPRRLWLQLRGVEGAPLPETIRRSYEEGRLHEPSILEWACHNLPGGPYQLRCQQMEISITPWLRGHIDGILYPTGEGTPVLVEAKALRRRAYTGLLERGALEAEPQYYTQVQLYLLGLQGGEARVTTAYLVARNKETAAHRLWDHYTEAIPYDEDYALAEVRRLENVLRAAESGEDVPPPYHPDTDWRCRYPWCVYAGVCWPDWRRARGEAVDRSDLADVVELYLEASEDIRYLEEFRRELRQKLEEEVVRQARVGRWMVSWAERHREYLDAQAARKILDGETLSRITRVAAYRTLKVEEVGDE